MTDPAGKARALYEARRTRVPIPPFTHADPGLGVADGYAQRELVPLLLAGADQLIGYKLGLTSKPMRPMIGVDSPDYGRVLASTVCGDRVPVPLDGFIAPKPRAEIVFVLAEELAGPAVSTIDARRAILGAAAVEIVDSRIQDWRIKLADTVGDPAPNGAVATSSRAVPLGGLEPRLIGMALTGNGELVDAWPRWVTRWRWSPGWSWIWPPAAPCNARSVSSPARWPGGGWG